MESSYSNKTSKSSSVVQLLKNSVPFSLPSGVKFNLFKACVLSVLLYGYPAWFPEASDVRKLEQHKIHGLRWCFGYNDYYCLLKLSNSLPICYQLIERDIRFFNGNLKQWKLHIFWQIFQVGLKDIKPTHFCLWTSGTHTS